MTDSVIKNIQELNDKRSNGKIVSECVLELKLSKKSAWQFIIAILSAFPISYYCTFKVDTVATVKEIVPVFLDVQVAMFAVIFGAYAIFQALMRDEIIKELIKTKNNILKDSNRTFLNLSILYIIDIFSTVVMNITVKICADESYIYNIQLSNILFFVGFFIYNAFNFMLILENINFVINLYRMFNVYNIYRALDVIEDKENK